MKYEPVIGLEVHAQLLTESKIFCSCSTKFGAAPNEHTCPVCLGLPGALPVLNEKAIELALKASIALNCHAPENSVFARKHYFYPDLPKGYQISQFDRPVSSNGSLTIQLDGNPKTIRIRRVHLEEDAGKLLHEGVESKNEASYVDLNRSGVPLIEIVTEPDLRSPQEAHAYLTELKAILRYIPVSLANMEEGNLRCDANISMRPEGSSDLGTKIEIKNLNSFRNVQKALEYEIERQTKSLEAGKKLMQETRLFNAGKVTTEPMRSKEEAHDYRYFPEPDLLQVPISTDYYAKTKQSIPELPMEKRTRFQKQYQLTYADAETLTDEIGLAYFYEDAAKQSSNPKQTANWILRDVLQKLKESGKSIEESQVKSEQIAELSNLIHKQVVSGTQAKEIFEEMWATRKRASDLVKEKGISQVSDTDELGKFVDQVIQENPEIVQRLKSGETKLQGVLVGMVMKTSKGKANPALVNELIGDRIK